MKTPRTPPPPAPPAPAPRVPDAGAILPIPTPAGVRFYRVFRAHEERVTLVPLSILEIADLLEALQRDQPRTWFGRLGARFRRRRGPARAERTAGAPA